MDRHELEVFVGNILHAVERGHQVEDDARVELKREWPTDRSRAARRIAGHANAAEGREIIWVIGVDEKKRQTILAAGVTGWLD